jgi:transcriptional regulator with XRE-family HTH domain
LRARAGLTQQELAERVGTSKSAICRLEDAGYEGHSLFMLKRIAAALDKRVEIRFMPAKRLRTAWGRFPSDRAVQADSVPRRLYFTARLKRSAKQLVCPIYFSLRAPVLPLPEKACTRGIVVYAPRDGSHASATEP